MVVKVKAIGRVCRYALQQCRREQGCEISDGDVFGRPADELELPAWSCEQAALPLYRSEISLGVLDMDRWPEWKRELIREQRRSRADDRKIARENRRRNAARVGAGVLEEHRTEEA